MMYSLHKVAVQTYIMIHVYNNNYSKFRLDRNLKNSDKIVVRNTEHVILLFLIYFSPLQCRYNIMIKVTLEGTREQIQMSQPLKTYWHVVSVVFQSFLLPLPLLPLRSLLQILTL